ncbi:ribosomal protein S5 domain 2-type protein [Leptodontidium sp. MPI-SDFR-AT-0119]|nr:ribosomal protein S5 domain 2-type protein [Leptodontidium sp. MPI-SDFR-AT-0119]
MNEELANEVEAINSIYGDDSLAAGEGDIFVLRLPQHDTSLRIRFPPEYPATPPAVLGIETSGEHTRKGDAANILAAFLEALGRLYVPGDVCLFDVIEEVNNVLPTTAVVSIDDEQQPPPPPSKGAAESGLATATATPTQQPPEQQVQWTLSDVVVELKSVFIARCTPVSSPSQAKAYLQHLLDSDKKVRSATHNITAWRIKGDHNVTYQDCDDDGETAAGGRVLHLMQLMDLWNVMVVITRWYGGHQLGPKRFSIINTVARDAFVKGGFVQEDSSAAKKKGKR